MMMIIYLLQCWLNPVLIKCQNPLLCPLQKKRTPTTRWCLGEETLPRKNKGKRYKKNTEARLAITPPRSSSSFSFSSSAPPSSRLSSIIIISSSSLLQSTFCHLYPLCLFFSLSFVRSFFSPEHHHFWWLCLLLRSLLLPLCYLCHHRHPVPHNNYWEHCQIWKRCLYPPPPGCIHAMMWQHNLSRA